MSVVSARVHHAQGLPLAAHVALRAGGRRDEVAGNEGVFEGAIRIVLDESERAGGAALEVLDGTRKVLAEGDLDLDQGEQEAEFWVPMRPSGRVLLSLSVQDTC
eukprot:tig00001292_g8048.t1